MPFRVISPGNGGFGGGGVDVQTKVYIADGTFPVLPGTLVIEIVAKPLADIILRLGFTAGGQELLEDTPIAAGTSQTFTIAFHTVALTQIFVGGITSMTKISIVRARMPL